MLNEHRPASTDAICERLLEVDGLRGDEFAQGMMRASTASNLEAFVAVVLYGVPPSDRIGPGPRSSTRIDSRSRGSIPARC